MTIETCKDCGKQLPGKLGKPFPFRCPACKDTRCFKCFGKHLEAKTCAYGKADKMPVSL